MKNKINWRVYISFGLTWSFLIIFVSGIVLYISPAGRYANWVNWKILGATKEGWQNIHTVFSLAFVILSIFHLFSINWKAFWSYIKTKSGSGINKKKEMGISLALTLAIFIGIVYSAPPFSYVSELGEYLGARWENQSQASPIPHAELLTISDLAKELHYSTDSNFIHKFQQNGIVFSNTKEQTLKEIALLNNKTPEELYEIITKKTGSEKPGAGMGKKTIENIALETGKTTEEIIEILKNNNIEAAKGQSIRQIGENNNISPKEIMDLLENAK